MNFPVTRAQALQTLEAFLPKTEAYSARRNTVGRSHEHVSRLSPAIRCRLVTEHEVAARVLKHTGLEAGEKFIQELYWRAYWKGFLEQRPHLWSAYRSGVETLCTDVSLAESCLVLEEGRTGVEPIDTFARELVETGYLHNHARMWFASYWVHAARLPWQRGADFFYRHLLDADPASNTLSWRWVAGLQTPGKTYLVSRQNIERFCTPELPRRNLDTLGQITPAPLPLEDPVTGNACNLPSALTLMNGTNPDALGIWLHGDDLSLETSPLAAARPKSICAICALDLFDGYRPSEPRQSYMQGAMCDALRRAGEHFGTAPECHAQPNLARAIRDWAETHRLQQVVAMRPTVGPLGDSVPGIEAQLSEAGIGLQWFRRPEDEAVWPLARKGFFPFWKSVRQDLDNQLELGI